MTLWEACRRADKLVRQVGLTSWPDKLARQVRDLVQVAPVRAAYCPTSSRASVCVRLFRYSLIGISPYGN